MNKLFFVIFQLAYLFFNSQTDSLTNGGDTIFFNKHWKKCEKKNAAYFRINAGAKNNYLVKDFYINGQIQMESEASAYEPLVQNGTSTYYYENGQKQASGKYNSGEQTGAWTYWKVNGKLKEVINHDRPEIKLYDSSSWTPQNQSSIFLVNLSYRYKVNNSIINSGHGFGLEIGVNLGYFISQKWLLGVFGGLGTRDILYGTKFNSKFLNDFNAATNVKQFSGNDSLVAVSALGFMNSGQGYFHDRTVYAGLMIRLPFKFAPIVKLYKGYSTYECKTSDKITLQPYSEKDQGYDHDYYEFYRTMDWGIEVFLFNGFSRVRDYDPEGLVSVLKKNGRWNRNLFGFSFYVERYDWRNASLSFSGNQSVDIPLRQLVGTDFLHKYKTEYIVGFRLSIGIF